MKQKFFILLTFFIYISAYSQSKIEAITLQIVDRNQSKHEQVESIYNWLTENIKYDIKLAEKPSKKKNTPEQTLKSKKAVCYGYSELFVEMCKAIDVKAFTVNGYAKGLGYMKGEDFYKSIHSWNVVLIDTNLVIVDATWGSGFVSHDWSTINKIKKLVFNRQYLKTKYKFTPYPNRYFFAPEPSKLIETHFPIDSKWQLLDYPVSYFKFVNDSNLTPEYLNYRKEINDIKNAALDYQEFVDANNSPKYNALNHTDKSFANYNRALAFYYLSKAPSVEVNNEIQKVSDALFDTASVCANIQKDLLKNKGRAIKKQYSLHQREAKSAYNGLQKELKKITFVSPKANKSKLKKQVEKNTANIGRTATQKQKYLKEKKFQYKPPIEKDAKQISISKENLQSNQVNMELKFNQLNQILSETIQAIHTEIGTNDTLVNHLIQLISSFSNASNYIDKMDFDSILIEQRKINMFIQKIRDIQKTQNQNKLDRINKQSEFEKSFANGKEIILQSLELNYKLAELTGENETYKNEYYTNMQWLVKIHNVKIEYLDTINTYLANDIASINKKVKQLNPIVKLCDNQLRLVDRFYNFLLSKNEDMFNQDIELLNQVIKNSKSYKSQLAPIIKANEPKNSTKKQPQTIDKV